MVSGGAKDARRWKGHAGAACESFFSKKSRNAASVERVSLNAWCEEWLPRRGRKSKIRPNRYYHVLSVTTNLHDVPTSLAICTTKSIADTENKHVIPPLRSPSPLLPKTHPHTTLPSPSPNTAPPRLPSPPP